MAGSERQRVRLRQEGSYRAGQALLQVEGGIEHERLLRPWVLQSAYS